jgi:predicted RNA-binding protein YlxR (DUF448 family)
LRVIRVLPGIDVGPQSVVVVTPMSNLEGRGYWVVTSDERDAFAIRLSGRIKAPVTFAWLVVQADLPDQVADEATEEASTE